MLYDGWPRAVGLAAGALLDAAVADPRRGHPVAAFGRLAAAAERRLYADRRSAGVVYAAGLVAGAAGLGAAVQRVTGGRPVATAAATAAATWAVLGGTSLRREAAAMQALLAADDLPGARRRLAHLCGRDAAELDPPELARAAVESVAENTADAVVGPLVWGAVAGLPGLLAYRAANTLDAMVGHRSDRYRRFGWAAARLDDLLTLLPARLTALLAVAAAPLVGGRPAGAWRVLRRDGSRHPSPNAGPVEAAFAGALGCTLGGPLRYAGRLEDRPRLGAGPAPAVGDLPRSARLSGAVQAAALLACAGLAARPRPSR